MKIALINPPFLFIYGKINTGHHCSFPLGIGYLASYIRHFGHEVAIFDPEASRTSNDELWEQLQKFKPDLVGLTSVTANFTVASRLATEAKRRLGCYVIMGGPHVTALPATALGSTAGLDAVIRGEGEIPLRVIAEQFDREGKVDFETVPGAAFFQNGRLHRVQRSRYIENLDEIPFPARNLTDLSWYTLHAHFQRGTKSATVLSSRGCPSKCTFCGNVISGRNFRAVSPEYFVRELETLFSQHRIRHFHIVDDCFTADIKRVERICDLIIEKQLPITWFCFGRADSLQDEKIVRKMKRAGCIYVLLGIESGNQRILDIMRKNTTIETIEDCCALLRKVGIKYFNSFIIGNEGDTEETVRETIHFAKRLGSVMGVFNIMIPFPGSPIFHKYYRNLDRADMDWSKFCAVGDDIPYEPRHTKLSKHDMLRLTSTAYRIFYLDPRQLMRILFFVKNIHTLFAYVKGAYGLCRQIVSFKK
jgi:anaerobic magnesium-protoporphyrin IX monomethyl ester cyclase